MEFLEGMTSALGEEFAKAVGLVQTKLAADAIGPTVVAGGNAITVSSVDGINLVFSASVSGLVPGVSVFRLDSFTLGSTIISRTAAKIFPTLEYRTIQCDSTTGMRPGLVIEITTGSLAGQRGLIDQIISDTEFTVENPGFTDVANGFDFEVYVTLQRREAVIDATPTDTTATLHDTGIGSDFTAEFFTCYNPGDTTLVVDSALDFPEEGTVAIQGSLYQYRSKETVVEDDAVVHRLLGLYPLSFRPFESAIPIPGSEIASISNHSILELYTGAIPSSDAEPVFRDAETGAQVFSERGVRRTKATKNFLRFEFLIDETSVLSALENIPVRIQPSATPVQAANELVRTINLLSHANVQAYREFSTVRIRDRRPGGVGQYPITSTDFDLGWGVGSPTRVGIDRDAVVGTLVTDWTKTFSALDQLRRGFHLRTAEGGDLTTVAANTGTNRPILMTDDEEFRRVAQAFTFSRRTSMLAVRDVLEAMLGPEGFEVLELMMYGSMADPNPYPGADLASNPINKPSIPNSFVDTGRVVVRRRYPTELDPKGRTFLTGGLHGSMLAGGTTLTIASPNRPRVVTSLRLADDPQRVELDPDSAAVAIYEVGPSRYRLIHYYRDSLGNKNFATSADGMTVVFDSNPGIIRIGDLFIPSAGPFNGRAATVVERIDPVTIRLSGDGDFVPGVAQKGLPSGFSAVGWAIRRERTNARYYIPTDDTYNEVTTAGSSVAFLPVTPWVLGTGSQTLSTGVGTVTAAPATPTQWYHTPTRFRAGGSRTSLRATIVPSFSATFAGNAFTLQLDEGVGGSLIIAALNYTGTNAYRASFHDATGVELSLSSPTDQVVYPAADFVSTGAITMELQSDRSTYRILINGRLAASTSTPPDAGASETMLVRYADTPVVSGTPPTAPLTVQELDWSVSTPTEFWNKQLPVTAFTTAAPDQLGDTGYSFAGDTGRRIVISRQEQPSFVGSPPYKSARGEWEIWGVASTKAVVYSPKHNGMVFIPDHADVLETHSLEFVWPDHQGHKVEVLSGPNVGTYTILRILAPDSLLDFDTVYPGFLLQTQQASDNVPSMKSNRVLLTASVPQPATTELAAWRIIPDWSSGVDVVGDLVETGTVVPGAPWTLTLGDASGGLSTGDLMEIQATTVDQGHTEDDIPLEIAAGDTSASSDLGLTIDLPPGTTSTVTSRSQGPAIRPGHQIQIFREDLPAPVVLITAVGTDSVTLATPLGANFSGARWTITSGPVNVDSGVRILEPAYLTDQWAYRADFLDDGMLAAGYFMDFDHALRDSGYAFPDVRGLRLID